jgi:hypothetical protein
MPFIKDMDPSSPANIDQRSEGADQMRTIKLDTQSSFPNIDGPVTLTPAELNAVLTPVLVTTPLEGQIMVWRTDKWVNEAGGVVANYARYTGQIGYGSTNISTPQFNAAVGGDMTIGTTTNDSTSGLTWTADGDYLVQVSFSWADDASGREAGVLINGLLVGGAGVTHFDQQAGADIICGSGSPSANPGYSNSAGSIIVASGDVISPCKDDSASHGAAETQWQFIILAQAI